MNTKSYCPEATQWWRPRQTSSNDRSRGPGPSPSLAISTSRTSQPTCPRTADRPSRRRLGPEKRRRQLGGRPSPLRAGAAG
eukprot:14947665-Alexandrium_andersonii.AAC.1